MKAGSKLTEEHKAKLRAANVGRTFTDMAKMNMSRSKKGVPWTPARRAAQERRKNNAR